MMRLRSYFRAPLMLGAVLSLAPACSKDDDVNTRSAPQTITINQPGLYPEGVQYDAARQRYFVSSLTRGAIGQVADDGTYAQYADDPRLISTAGLHLDSRRGRLLVVVSDPNPGVSTRTSAATVGQFAALATVDARAAGPGAVTGFVNLGVLRPGQDHLPNDVAVDGQGNAYVTDSYSPIIYRVTPQGVASVFYENNSLDAPVGGYGFNGIVYHPDGFLLVAHTALGVIFKIPVAAPEPVVATPVAMGSQSLVGADGLLLFDDETLLVVANNTVFRLGSSDNFTSMGVSGTFATGTTFPTTLTRRDNEVYVLYAFLGALFGGQPPVSQFIINKVTF